MKKISLFLIMALLLTSGGLMANDVPEPTRKLTFQISQMLNKDSLSFIPDGAVAEVRLSVDSFGQIHVLSVETSDENLKRLIMNAVDSNTVQRDSYRLGVVYRIPIEVAG